MTTGLIWLFLGADPIYRCQTEAGEVHFSDHRCPPGTELRETIVLGPGSGLSLPTLTPTEEHALETLADRLAQETESAQLARRRAALLKQEEAALAKRRCEHARQQLAQLREQRRQGYALTDEAALQAAEDEARRARSAFC